MLMLPIIILIEYTWNYSKCMVWFELKEVTPFLFVG